MPVYSLSEQISFPPPQHAEKDGLLAVGGDLSPDRLVNAYALGIFPWYSKGYPIMWWSPDPRMVLFPSKFKRNKSLRQIINKKVFDVKFNTCFEKVIRNCSKVPRTNQDGTWIVDEMIEAYIKLNKLGVAQSVEVFQNDELVGGLYGLAIGKAFFGESMFFKKSNASKVAMWYLVDKLVEQEFDIIDAQQETAHLKSLGAELISREKFLNLLEIAISKHEEFNLWTND